MIAEVAHAEPGKRGWRVAANPLHFSAAPAPQPTTPPRIGADNGLLGTPAEPTSIEEKRSLRDAFGAFATGVTVITTRQDDGVPRGFTANSFTSVSLDPPLLLVCLAKSAKSCEVFAQAEHFAVNVLSESQKDLSGLFASQRPDKFDIAAWRAGAGDVPLLDGALAHFACARHRLVDAGDHLVLIGRVIDHGVGEGAPLGYFRGNYFSVGLEEPLVEAVAEGGNVTVGAVLQNKTSLLLCVGPDGAVSVPKAPHEDATHEGLCQMLETAGMKVETDFLYAVFRDRETGAHGIFYHGSVSGPPAPGMAYVAQDEVPLDRVSNAAERSMLARYLEEFRHGSFGIYQGSETAGTVRRLAAREPKN
jgi:flavin reductase (DIM6/NTAB) family NADH-FMN oxidoreductase RutF